MAGMDGQVELYANVEEMTGNAVSGGIVLPIIVSLRNVKMNVGTL